MCKHGKTQRSISTVQGFVPKLCRALQTLSGIGMMSLMSDIGEQHAMQNAKIDCALQAVIQDHLWKLETLWNSWKKSRLVCVIQNSIDFGSNLPNNPEGPERNWIGLRSDEHHQDTQTVSQAGSPSLQNECNSRLTTPWSAQLDDIKGTTPHPDPASWKTLLKKPCKGCKGIMTQPRKTHEHAAIPSPALSRMWHGSKCPNLSVWQGRDRDKDSKSSKHVG